MEPLIDLETKVSRLFSGLNVVRPSKYPLCKHTPVNNESCHAQYFHYVETFCLVIKQNEKINERKIISIYQYSLSILIDMGENDT